MNTTNETKKTSKAKPAKVQIDLIPETREPLAPKRGTQLEREFMYMHFDFIELALRDLARQVRNNETVLLTEYQRRMVLTLEAAVALEPVNRSISSLTARRVSLVAKMLVELGDACAA